MTTPILSLRDVSLTFGGKPLFEGISLSLCMGDKVCLVGRNGSGKSTLLKCLSGLFEVDKGERFIQPGTVIKYLAQDVVLPPDKTVFDFVMEDGAEPFMAESILGKLGVPGDRLMDSLSGGERRRVALAQVLAVDSDVLILDEPTNHLDLPTIEWLEDYLGQYRGALIVISHDRTFLENVSTSTWWLDRGKAHEHGKGFKDYDIWSEQILDDEERQLERLNSRLRLENEWLHRGVTARRKRNQGRLRRLHALRGEKKEHLSNQAGKVKLETVEGGYGSKMVCEVHGITKSFGDRAIIKPFTTRIIKGERIGIIGPNGAGKTTLLKLLVGKLQPDSGTVKIGANIQLIYFDQMRETLSQEDTLWQTLCPQGGDQVMVQGKPRHVVSYLKDFLFNEKQIRGQVSILSGGEKNRLVLAKSLAQTGNLLVLDEPTNDLDMDTLDLLVDLLSDYEGTLLLVSHDRDFLDKLTTSIIAVEGNGIVNEYVGGYADYLRQRAKPVEDAAKKQVSTAPKQTSTQPKTRLSYNQKRELEQLPGVMDKLSQEINIMETKLADPSFYEKHPQDFLKFTNDLAAKRQKLDEAELRWLELEELQDESRA
ncbi:MAG: ABC-F family ATP-binding cassette domain-containing protein [Alphaproteobacteria bacterium]|nr:ABC-F family ATP-binding cassette domain-containing protein [Alphaproteobacteria bacterium]